MEQLHDATRHTTMSIPQQIVTQHRYVTPPSRPTDQPLTPPLTDKKPFTEAFRVIELFRQSQAGVYTKQEPWTEFKITTEEYNQIERTLQQDDELSGYVDDKIRFDYDEDKCTLVIRMPTEKHERFLDQVEDEIRTQLKEIRSGSDKKAQFAQQVEAARSTEIRFAASDLSSKSKYEPDASFRHENAEYPGLIIEVAYSQKKKRLDRLAESYILNSYANVRAVIGLDIEYGKRREATLSIWRPQISHTPNGPELRAVEELTNEAFRDDEGNPVDHPGVRLSLSDFACEDLARKELGDGDGDEDTWICISGRQLCQYLDKAESKPKKVRVKQSLPKGIMLRARSETPPDKVRADDEAEYVLQE